MNESCVGAFSIPGVEERSIKNFCKKSEGKRTLRRPRHR